LTYTSNEIVAAALLAGGALGALIAKTISYVEYRIEAPRHVNCTVPGCQYQRRGKVSGRRKTGSVP
jgi:hypothetical protein